MGIAGKSVLVTGGAGFIGSHLVDRIIQGLPGNLVVLDNLFLGRGENLDQARNAFPRLKFYQEDAADYETMKRIITAEQVDVVFNLAVVPLPTSLERPRWTIDVNVAIATVACELIREACYKTLIHFSSSEVYGSAKHVPMDENHPLFPCTPYAASKAAGDHVVLSYVETFDIDAAIVRPFNNFGPRQNSGAYAGIIPIVITRALQGEPIVIYGDGEQTRDFIFVRETADAAVRVYEQPATRGQVINVATGRELPMNRLVREILAVLDIEVPIIHDAPRPGDVRRHCGGVGLAQRLIDFQSNIVLADGLVETVNWYRQKLGALENGNAR